MSGLSFKLPAGFLNLAFSLFPFWAHCLRWEGCARWEGNICPCVHQGDPWEFNNHPCSCLIKHLSIYTHSFLRTGFDGTTSIPKVGGEEKKKPLSLPIHFFRMILFCCSESENFLVFSLNTGSYFQKYANHNKRSGRRESKGCSRDKKLGPTCADAVFLS